MSLLQHATDDERSESPVDKPSKITGLVSKQVSEQKNDIVISPSKINLFVNEVCQFCLTLSQASPGFYVSAVQVF